MSDHQSREGILAANRALLVLHSVRTAAHELNNVFQMISGSAELLLANPSFPETLVPRAESVMRQSSRGESIMRAVADLARPEGPAPAALDLAGVARQALEMRSFEHRRAGITVHMSIPSGTSVRAGSRDVLQLVLNLLIMAEISLAGGAGAAISVEGAREGETVTMTITDSAGHDVAAETEAGFLQPARTLAHGLGGALNRSAGRSELRLPAATGQTPPAR